MLSREQGSVPLLHLSLLALDTVDAHLVFTKGSDIGDL